MKDCQTNIDELKEAVARFAKERDWEQFHSLKNLSMSIAIEAAELMERFQWSSGASSEEQAADREDLEAIEEELSDVFIYLLQFANRAGIDMSGAAERKLALNALKYPIAKSRGRSEKYDSL